MVIIIVEKDFSKYESRSIDFLQSVGHRVRNNLKKKNRALVRDSIEQKDKKVENSFVEIITSIY